MADEAETEKPVPVESVAARKGERMKSSYPEFVGADESSRLYREVCTAVFFGCSLRLRRGCVQQEQPCKQGDESRFAHRSCRFRLFSIIDARKFCFVAWAGIFFLARAWLVLAEGDDGHTQRRNIRRRGVRFLRRGPVSPGRPKGAYRKAASMGIGERSAGTVFP